MRWAWAYVALAVACTQYDTARASDVCLPRWLAAAEKATATDIETEASDFELYNQPSIDKPATSPCDRTAEGDEIQCWPAAFEQNVPTEFRSTVPREFHVVERTSRLRTNYRANGGWIATTAHAQGLGKRLQATAQTHCEGSICYDLCPVATSRGSVRSTVWFSCLFDGPDRTTSIPRGCRQVGYSDGRKMFAFAIVKYVRSSGVVQNFV